MHRPVIGLMPNVSVKDTDGEKKIIPFVPQAYIDSITEAGGEPFVLPFTDDPAERKALAGRCDGFFFTGGEDVQPSVYCEAPIPQLGGVSPLRDSFESGMLFLAIRLGKPVFACCRGIQIINALLGGTLYQDLPTQFPGKELLCHVRTDDVSLPCHGVRIKEGTLLSECCGTEAEVNSTHHQAVKDVSPFLSVTAVADDGVTEGLEMPGHPFFQAVQWHPEEMAFRDGKARALIRRFVEACEKKSAM